LLAETFVGRAFPADCLPTSLNGPAEKGDQIKLREFFYLLGFRPKIRTYGFAIASFDLPQDGKIELAQWLHPKERRKIISQAQVDELRKYLSPGDVAIDIGAHTGDTAVPLALAVGKSGLVLALEPNSYVFPVLRANSELNLAKTSIMPLMFAATPEDGEFEFEYSDSGFCNGGRHEGINKWKHTHAFKLSVAGKNLQTYLASELPALVPRIRFLKVDAEGYDYTVLSSLSELITKQRPFIRVEVYKWTDRPRRTQLYRFLREHHYDVFRLIDDQHYLGPEVREQDLMKWPSFDVFCTPRRAVES
jgi:FkbM family methyltransferase